MTNIAGDFLMMDPRDHWSNDERLAGMRDMIDLISDQKLRSLVSYMLTKANALWEAPVGQNNDGTYPDDEYQPGGLLRHTRRAVKSYVYLCTGMDFTIDENDCAVAALILRNVVRATYIDEAKRHIFYDPFYLYQVEGFLENITLGSEHSFEDNGAILGVPMNNISLIMRLIRTSDGFMSVIPETYPNSPLERLVHFATIMGSSCHDILNEQVYND